MIAHASQLPEWENRTYGPAQACLVAGVPRATFHSWLARKYLEITSLGTGKAREFTFRQVVQIAVIGELVKMGTPVATAAVWSSLIEFEWPIPDTGAVLVIPNAGRVRVAHRKEGESLESLLLGPGGLVVNRDPFPPLSHTLLDLSGILKVVRSRLALSESESTLSAGDQGRQPAPDPRPARKSARGK